ncbi:MAG: hypothetical protein KDI36_18510, partial [Pseudomonadales bacterium]|nr:hypothetical protein [Pseudomonadales bacterium]
VDVRAPDRDLNQISIRMASLLYHELAHANDFFPPALLNQIDRTVPMYQAISTTLRPSSQMTNLYPLRSVLMNRLAGVSFRGETVRSADTQLTADDIAAEFPTDFASDFYSYTTEREDFAMLVEEAMMKYSYNLDRDVAVTVLPETLESCSQLTVSWGQRNRVAETAIQARAAFAVQAVFPEIAAGVEAYIATLTPRQMENGKDWCSNIFMSAPAADRSLVTGEAQEPADLMPGFYRDYL